MFVSLKNRGFAVTALVVAFLFVLSACGSAPSKEPESPEVNYSLRMNWPNIAVDGVVAYEETGEVCVVGIACAPVDAVFVRAAFFAGIAPIHETTMSSTKTAEELQRWREVAVTNICFVDSWEAYVAGALLFFAYDDGADVFDLADLMRSFDSCMRANVLQQPQS